MPNSNFVSPAKKYFDEAYAQMMEQVAPTVEKTSVQYIESKKVFFAGAVTAAFSELRADEAVILSLEMAKENGAPVEIVDVTDLMTKHRTKEPSPNVNDNQNIHSTQRTPTKDLPN